MFYCLAIDNDWANDIGANMGIEEGIEITFKRGSRIADQPPVPSILEGILDPPNPNSNDNDWAVDVGANEGSAV